MLNTYLEIGESASEGITNIIVIRVLHLHICFQIDGEASFSVPLQHIKDQQSSLSGYSLLVEANVTESLNKITLNGSSTVEIYENAVKLDFLSSNPETFKPGLDYIAYVSGISL